MLVKVADDSKSSASGPACTNVHNILSPVLVHVDVRLKWSPQGLKLVALGIQAAILRGWV